MTALAAETLAEDNEELQAYLSSNATLLKMLESEMLHTESLTVQMLQSQAVH